MKLAMTVLAISAVLALGACQREAPAPPAPAGSAPAITELQKTDLVKGTGEGISQGQTAVVHYTGWLYDPSAPEQKGREFDSSLRRGEPFEFTVGTGGVIRGWEEGVQGMQPGGHRRLVIPPALAYGERGAGGGVIPPDAALVFEIELLAIK